MKTIPITECLPLNPNTGGGRRYFCSKECINIHEKTGQLLKHQEKNQVLLSPSQLLLAKVFLQSKLNQQNTSKTSETNAQEKQSLKVKPDHQLLAPPNVSRVPKTRRMVIRDQPTRRFREMQNTDRRRRHREHKPLPQTNGKPKTQLPKPHIPFPSPSILPPPTLMLPYPVFLPIPLPLFLPVPVDHPQDNKSPKEPNQYQDLDLCESIARKGSEKKEDTLVEPGDNEVPLVVDIKQEEYQDPVVVDAEEGKCDTGKETTQVKIKNKRPKTREEEIRRKRRALIMDR